MFEYTQEQIEEMKQVDIRTVSREELRDICEVKVNHRLKGEERIKDFLEQVGNPYCFNCGGYIVKVGFTDTSATLTGCLKEYVGRVSKANF